MMQRSKRRPPTGSLRRSSHVVLGSPGVEQSDTGDRRVSSQRTLIILKPDAIERRLEGQILERFARTGLQLVKLEMRQATRDLIRQHYPSDDEWFGVVGNKTLSDYATRGLDPLSELGTNDPITLGKSVKEWLVEFMTSAPLIAAVYQGPNAVLVGRKVAGATLPVLAEMGSIRGDFSTDSPDLANNDKRPIRNLVHASDERDAEREIALWFPE